MATKNSLAPVGNVAGFESALQKRAGNAVATALDSLLDSENLRKRFDELLGKRTAQFISSLIALCNGDEKLKEAALLNPRTVVQAALKAATFDLPIDPNLGYAYIIPFKKEATFIMGYKGMKQLALRTGVYKTLNVIDVREGELVHYNRLSEEVEFAFIENEEERQKKKTIGWCGYYKLMSGTEKTIYRTRAQLVAHERKHRKGDFMGKVWKEDFDAMAEKTVYRELIGKHGLMSIDYQRADSRTIEIAEKIAAEGFDDEDMFAEDEEQVTPIDTPQGAVQVDELPADDLDNEFFNQG